MLGQTKVTSHVDIDREYRANYKVWVTQEGMFKLIGVEFFHFFKKALYFDFPVVEFINNIGITSYGTLNNKKQYPQ